MSAQDTNQATFLEGYKTGYQSGFSEGFKMSMQAAIMINASAPAPNPLLSTAPPTAAPSPPIAAPKGPVVRQGLSRRRRKRGGGKKKNREAKDRIKAAMPAPLVPKRQAEERKPDVSAPSAPKRQTEESKPAMSTPRAPKRQIEESDGDMSASAAKRRCLGGPAATTAVPTPPVASTARLVPAAGGVTAVPVVPGPAMRTTNNGPVSKETIDDIEIVGYMGRSFLCL